MSQAWDPRTFTPAHRQEASRQAKQAETLLEARLYGGWAWSVQDLFRQFREALEDPDGDTAPIEVILRRLVVTHEVEVGQDFGEALRAFIGTHSKALLEARRLAEHDEPVPINRAFWEADGDRESTA
jgi:hypothetical protein